MDSIARELEVSGLFLSNVVVVSKRDVVPRDGVEVDNISEVSCGPLLSNRPLDVLTGTAFEDSGKFLGSVMVGWILDEIVGVPEILNEVCCVRVESDDSSTVVVMEVENILTFPVVDITLDAREMLIELTEVGGIGAACDVETISDVGQAYVAAYKME